MTAYKMPIVYLIHHFLVIAMMIMPLDASIKMVGILLSFYFIYGAFTKEEVYLFVGVNIFFTFMNYMSIINGIFVFSHPNLIGLPWYEFFMWGIYVIHLKRITEIFFKKEFTSYPIGMVDFICVGLVITVFSICKDKSSVTFLPLIINIFYLISKKSKLLVSNYLYFIAIGGILELVGTNGGQWSYPQPDFFGVPFWYVNVFGSFALYFPLVYKGMNLALNTDFMRGFHEKCIKLKSYSFIHYRHREQREI